MVFRKKHLITASKAHAVKTRMSTCGCKGAVATDLTAIFEIIAGNKPVNPSLSPLKYGLAMEDEAVETFFEKFSKERINARLKEFGLFICSCFSYQIG